MTSVTHTRTFLLVNRERSMKAAAAVADEVLRVVECFDTGVFVIRDIRPFDEDMGDTGAEADIFVVRDGSNCLWGCGLRDVVLPEFRLSCFEKDEDAKTVALSFGVVIARC